MSQTQTYGPVGGGVPGNVVGPASSTNNAVAKWNGTTGKLLADSCVLIDSANTITLPAGQITHGVFPGSYPYTVLATDYFIGVDSSSAAVSILLPNAPTTWQVFIIKDKNGNAFTNNITVTTVSGSVKIDNQTSFLISNNYGASSFIFDGTAYEVF